MNKPYNNTDSKKNQVEQMFDGISGNYDFLNRFLSAGTDVRWRKKIRKIVEQIPNNKILDVATGTADLCIELSKIRNANLTGVDISTGMLQKGVIKIDKKELNNRIKLIEADSEDLPFESNVFDVVTVSFGVRNFENLNKGLNECLRVLKPGGTMIILEFSNPTKTPIKQLFNIYSGKIMPSIGGLLSKDKKAYKYLHDSSRNFPNGDSFLKILNNCGFVESKFTELSFGIASIYQACKMK